MATIPVVICDDSRMARKQMARALETWDVSISFAEHGLEALELIREGKGDLLFLDLTMPIMDGYQTLERIRQEDLPTMVIVVSGDIQREAEQRVMSLGALAFIKKPTTQDRVSEILRSYGLLDEIEGAPHAFDSVSGSDHVADCIREIANIASGKTVQLIAELLQVFIHMPIPIISMLTAEELEAQLQRMSDQSSLLVSQGFSGVEVSGEAVMAFNQLASESVMGHITPGAAGSSVEATMVLSNILSGSFISALESELNLDFSRSTPVVLLEIPDNEARRQSLAKHVLIGIAYDIPEYSLQCDLLVVFTTDSSEPLRQLASYFENE